MEKILPIAAPIINCFPRYGHTFSIVGAHTQEHLPWVYNFFVQLYSPDKLNGEARVDYMYPDIYNKLPWLEINYIKKEIGYKIMKGLELIKTYIDAGYYFYAFFKVDEIAAYKNHLHYHDPLIYGYSDEKEEFYFADNYKNGKYGLGVASYKEMESAINNYAREDPFHIICIKYKNDKKWKTFQFDKEAYISFLRDYVEQTNCARCWAVPGVNYKFMEGRRWGIGVYSYIQEYLDEMKKSNMWADHRGLYVILEHKRILEKALTYMLGEQWKEKYPLVWELIEKDIRMANIALHLFLKYEITLDKQILDKVKFYIAGLEENDYRLFPCLISILESV